MYAGPNAMPENIEGYSFYQIGTIQLQDVAGNILEYRHQLPEGIRKNQYAGGPFCKFRLPRLPDDSGVYMLQTESDLLYIGRCSNLKERFSARGYGAISPRNCHHDGQATNCKINALVLELAKQGVSITLWFYPTPDYKLVELRLIKALNPRWNGQHKR